MKLSIKPTIIYLLCTITLFSCRKENPAHPHPCRASEVNLTDIHFSDDSLYNTAYSTYKYPKDFYHENLGDTNLYYVYLVSIGNNHLTPAESKQLSTNDEKQALKWAEKTARGDQIISQTLNNKRYFEFISDRPMKLRVHKSSYFEHLNHDVWAKDDTIGVFKAADFCGEDAKDLVDYLWFVRNYNHYGSKILTSFFQDFQNDIIVHHYQLMIMGADIGLPDSIFLIHKKYQINKLSGLIIKKEHVLKRIDGK